MYTLACPLLGCVVFRLFVVPIYFNTILFITSFLLQVFPKLNFRTQTIECLWFGILRWSSNYFKTEKMFVPSRHVICTGDLSSIKTTVENWTCGLIIQLCPHTSTRDNVHLHSFLGMIIIYICGFHCVNNCSKWWSQIGDNEIINRLTRNVLFFKIDHAIRTTNYCAILI